MELFVIISSVYLSIGAVIGGFSQVGHGTWLPFNWYAFVMEFLAFVFFWPVILVLFFWMWWSLRH